MESTLEGVNVGVSIKNEDDGSHPADPISPVVPVQVEDSITMPNVTETDDEKIILTLESLHYSTESAESAKKIEENQRALEKLDKLLQTNSITRKKIIKTGNEENTDTSLISIKTSAMEKKAPRILNATLAKSPNPENKRLLNNIGKAIPSEEDLLAILEGSSQDEETDVDVKVIEDADSGNNKTMTTVLLSKNQELKIAADQIKEISRKTSKQGAGVSANTNDGTIGTTELVSSIASEWSDNEHELSEEIIEVAAKPKQTLKQNTQKRKVESTLVVVTATGDSSENKKSGENVEIKADKTEVMTGIAPFKRSRIIKKKIIWDPDAPETQFSYASLIKPKAKQNTTKKASKGGTNESINKSDNESSSKKVIEKKTSVANRKRKDVSPDKMHEKIEEALNKILSDEINSAVSPKNPSLTTKTKEAPQVKKPRITKTKQTTATSSSWDYINKGRSDEMMIIRRRSSSYSSTASQRRMSVEQQHNTTPSPKSIKVIKKVVGTESLKAIASKKRRQEIQLRKVTATKNSAENQENSIKAIPVVKKLSIAETRKLVPPSPASQPTIINKKLNKQTPAADLDKAIVSTNLPSTNSKPQKVEKKITKSFDEKPKGEVEIILKKTDSVVNFIIDLKIENPPNTFSVNFIKKFISTLEQLKKDNTCKIVVVTSKSTHFCHGIDFSCLIAPTIEKRKAIATELAKNIKLLFEALINFNKPIIAAVGGLVSNLGVTMLPLFDVVFASDKCAFEMTYSKIGQIPEGNCILNTLNMDKKYKMKLIYLSEKLTASEALSAGLLTAVYPAQRFEAEALNIATKMASLSQQTYKSMKQICLQTFTSENFMQAIEEEQKYLVEHWTSAECQEKFKGLMQK